MAIIKTKGIYNVKNIHSITIATAMQTLN